MKTLFFLLVFLPLGSWAGIPSLNYKSITCHLLEGDKVVKEHTTKLMLLTIEDHLGRFAEIQFGDETQKIQYQLLIEDDTAVKSAEAILVLQNLMVGQTESSSEFAAKEVSWVRIAQGTYSVSCDLKNE